MFERAKSSVMKENLPHLPCCRYDDFHNNDDKIDISRF
jgi:hypothetical protein